MAHMHDAPRRIIAAAVTLLLLCVVHYTQEAHAVTANDFTAEQRTHTARFLKGFLSGATELQSTWTGTDFCGWLHVSCPDATTVNVVLTGKPMGSKVTLAELSDDVDGSQVMVRKLRVADQGSLLAGTLPGSWWRLTQLRELDLQNNRLHGTLPASWGGMTALETLHLHVNALTGTLPAEWASMKAVWSISLMKNSLSGPLPAVWGSLPAETYVYVTANTFCGCVPATWSSRRYLVDAPLSATTCATANACTTSAPTTAAPTTAAPTTAAPTTAAPTTAVPTIAARTTAAPAKPSVRNFTALWAVLGLLGGCVSIAGVVVAVVLYRRRATAAAATAEERGDISVVSDTSSREPYAGAGNKTE